MLKHLTDYWETLFTHVDRACERRLQGVAPRAMAACSCEPATPLQRTPPKSAASRAERLEHIALFARAGYFDMGQAVDLLQPPPVVPFD